MFLPPLHNKQPFVYVYKTKRYNSFSLPMTKPLLIPVQLTGVVTAEQLTASLLAASDSGLRAMPKLSTLNRIKARARAVRPL